jgi:Protein of unknown function (DUF3826)
MRICLLFIFSSLISFTRVIAQGNSNAIDKDAVYTQTITTRAKKIVQTLEISDSSKATKITGIIADQYRNLNTFYSQRDDQIKSIQQKGLSKEVTDSEIKTVQNFTDKKLEELHSSFLSALTSELTPEQVTKVKDGMTYNVLNVTYDAYVDMIPNLTREQKNQIMVWLVEAREHAMDGESSEKKHWWFGKYKGRINNYLSAQGYDITKERKQWEAKTKQQAEQKSKTQIQ